jgi:hypothetical protein
MASGIVASLAGLKWQAAGLRLQDLSKLYAKMLLAASQLKFRMERGAAAPSRAKI